MIGEMEQLSEEAAKLEQMCASLEKRLQQSKDRFQKIFHASSNMMLISTLKDGRIIDLNEASAAMGGFKREDLIGTLSSDHNLWADPKQRESVVQTLKTEGRIHNFEVDFNCRHGEKRRVLFSADPITINGEACLLSTSIDITSREKEAEEVRKSEEKYRMLVENSLQGLIVIQDARIVLCNKAFAAMSGYSIEELLHLPHPSCLIHPEHMALVMERHRNRTSGKGALQNYEYRILRKDGTDCWVEVFASLIEYNGKSAAQIIHIDITERKAAEEALRESEERFRLIAELIDEAFWVYDLEKEAAIYLSPAHERIWGYSREQFANLQKPFLDPVYPDDKERVLASLSSMRAGQKLDYEHRFTRPDGELRYIRVRGFPVHAQSGHPKYYVGIGQDVTESRRAEAMLKESGEYLYQVISRIADPVFVKDREHIFVLVNEAFCTLFAGPPEEFLGKTGLEDLPEELAASIWKKEESLFNTGKGMVSEDTLKDADGNARILMTRTSLLTDKDGGKQIIGVLRDITEYKKLEAQFLQAQKMEAIGVLAGGVAHDFNNLLNVINGYTELVLDDVSKDDPIYRDLQKIRDAGKQATELTSQLLAFGRKQILQPEVIDLNTIIRQMSPMLRRLIGEDIEFVTACKPDLGLIHADPGQIQQIIMNLAVNARDAMPQGGKLIIGAENVTLEEAHVHRHPMAKEGPHVMLSIRDSGIGMDEATQSHLFEPFFTTKQKGKRTGLGLSTVYGIVKQSNGFIQVNSEPGKGSTFNIYFPRTVGGKVPEAQGEGVALDLAGSETVLVVEDEASVRSLASRILSDQGYQVLEAPEGVQALRIAREHKGDIHVLLTDVVMPGMSGSALAAQIKAERPGIKTVFMSGYTDDAIVRHGVLDSEVAFLQKPFTIEGLTRKVREALQSQND